MINRRCPACRSKRISERPIDDQQMLICRACLLTFPPFPTPQPGSRAQRVTNPVTGKSWWRQVR